MSEVSLSSRGRTASFSSITDSFPLLRTHREGRDHHGPRSREQTEKLWGLMSSYLASDVHSIQRQIANHIEYTLASSRFDLDSQRAYIATARSVRDRLIESWNDTNAHFDAHKVKRVAYLSLEFLMGRSMQNALLNMDLEVNYKKALTELGYDLEVLYEEEPDAALGNGGLGRLAACFLDSMATLDLPAWGYGIRYTYGIFKQLIRDGAQVEVPDYWLTFGNPWEIERVDVVYPIRFYGEVRADRWTDGSERSVWEGGEVVQAVAYDNPIPGFDTFNTINLRLFRAMPAREFDLASFTAGDYMKAVEQRQRAETISSVLYPSDASYSGKELRLKQQYFFASATLRDSIRRFKRLCPGWPAAAVGGAGAGHGSSGAGSSSLCVPGMAATAVPSFGPVAPASPALLAAWRRFPEMNALQLNDTHPTIAIAELQRILMDEEGLTWEDAWAITTASFGYTNHTVLPEALERWSVDLLGHLLPRHLQIIYTINWHHLEAMRTAIPDPAERERMIPHLSLVEEGPVKMIRMAALGIVGSHAVNGVAALHTELLKSDVFPAFFKVFPDRFQNKTNGVTPRRWLNQCNPGLAAILTRWLGSESWLTNLTMLTGLRAVADRPELHEEWAAVKDANKERLAKHILASTGVAVRHDALFDVQVKRLHEYKRQQLNALYCIHRYRWIKSLSPAERARVVPRVTIFGGKAAPSYEMAKRIIRLIHRIGAVVNADPDIGDLYKVVFLPNYNVSLAEVIVPANDLSQHISTAGMEASGTSNMKFAMNGGLIIGTMDGANVEIAQEIGEENMFVFGARADEVPRLRTARMGGGAHGGAAAAGGAAAGGFELPPELAAVVTDLQSGRFGSPEDVAPLLHALQPSHDWYLVAHDFPLYLAAQAEVDRVYADKREWTRRTILSVAGMAKFSTDRTIDEYARDIWAIEPCRRPRPVPDAMGTARSFPALVDESGAPATGVASAAPHGGAGGQRAGSGSGAGASGMALGSGMGIGMDLLGGGGVGAGVYGDHAGAAVNPGQPNALAGLLQHTGPGIATKGLAAAAATATHKGGPAPAAHAGGSGSGKRK